MGSYWIAAAVLMGLWLAVADWAAVEVLKSRGKLFGAGVWLVGVLFPVIVVSTSSIKLAFTSVVAGAAISAVSYWFYRREQRERHWTKDFA